MRETRRKSMLVISKLLFIILVSLLLAGCPIIKGDTTYTVSGRVTLLDGGSGLGDVKLQFSGGHGIATTRSDGSWTKSGLKGNVTITPVKDGWAFTPSSRNVSGARSDIDFQASPTETYSASGYVRDGLGIPISGVAIEFDRHFSSVSTGSDGKWTKPGLSGTVIATPRKNGWTFNPGNRPLTPTATTADFTGGYTVSGRVADKSGRGVGYAKLTFDGSSYSTTADENGYWTKAELSGSITVTARKDRWTFSPPSRTVSEPDSDVSFEGTYRADGRVRDADGSAVSSVSLDFSGGHRSVYTDSYGHWTRDGLFGDVTVTPLLSDWTFNPPSHTITSPDYEYSFTRTYTVSGRVTDQQGNGVRSVAITFSGGHRSSFTDENGYWTKEGLSGPITVTPNPTGYTFDPQYLIVDKPSSNVDFTAIPQSTGYSVSGRVTDQHGAGIADVLLFLGGGFGTARTGSTGFWSASELSGDVTVTPAETGLVFTPETVTISGSSSNVDFVGNPVTNAYMVSGKVIDSRNGSGLYKVSFTFSGGFGRTQSDVYGNWSKSGLYGTATVTPSRPGWTFAPESRVVTGTNSFADFSGTPTDSSASDGGGR